MHLVRLSPIALLSCVCCVGLVYADPPQPTRRAAPAVARQALDDRPVALPEVEQASSEAVGLTPYAVAGLLATGLFCGLTLAGLTALAGTMLAARREETPVPDSADESPAADDASTPGEGQWNLFAKRQAMLQTLLGEADSLLKSQLRVQHLMTEHPLVLEPATPTEEIEQLAAERAIRHFLVCDDEQRLIGVISDRDLLGRAGPTAADLMTPRPHTVTPSTSLASAISLLLKHRISSLPVVRDGRPVGIVTTTDLVLSLQCTMQLLLRVAHTVQADPDWAQQRQELSRAHEELSAQKEQFVRLQHQLNEIGLRRRERCWKGLRQTADAIMATAKRLSLQLESAANLLHQQTLHLMVMAELRADPASGAASRRSLEEWLAVHLAVLQRYRTPCSLVLVRLDGLAALAARDGSDAADEFFRLATSRVRDTVRTTDQVARFDVDCLAVLLPQTVGPGAHCLGERLAALFEGENRPEQRAITIAVAALRADDTFDGLIVRTTELLGKSELIDAPRLILDETTRITIDYAESSPTEKPYEYMFDPHEALEPDATGSPL